jgi:hypothetical protein
MPTLEAGAKVQMAQAADQGEQLLDPEKAESAALAESAETPVHSL